MSIEEYHGFHGTDISNAQKIIGKSGPNVSISGFLNGNYRNEPGNFGYGFYTFLGDPQLAFKFAKKFHAAENIQVCSLFCKVDENNVLDLRHEILKKQFLSYAQSNERAIVNHLKIFGKTSNKPEVLTTGIAVELFIHELRKRNYHVNVVMGESYTKERYGINLTVPNGTEMNIRNKDIIKSIERYEKEEL